MTIVVYRRDINWLLVQGALNVVSRSLMIMEESTKQTTQLDKFKPHISHPKRHSYLKISSSRRIRTPKPRILRRIPRHINIKRLTPRLIRAISRTNRRIIRIQRMHAHIRRMIDRSVQILEHPGVLGRRAGLVRVVRVRRQGHEGPPVVLVGQRRSALLVVAAVA